jgi:hypothetical protein
MLEDFQFLHKNAHILRQNRELDADIITEWNTRFENFQAKAAQFELFFRLFLDAPNRVIFWVRSLVLFNCLGSGSGIVCLRGRGSRNNYDFERHFKVRIQNLLITHYF